VISSARTASVFCACSTVAANAAIASSSSALRRLGLLIVTVSTSSASDTSRCSVDGKEIVMPSSIKIE